MIWDPGFLLHLHPQPRVLLANAEAAGYFERPVVPLREIGWCGPHLFDRDSQCRRKAVATSSIRVCAIPNRSAAVDRSHCGGQARQPVPDSVNTADDSAGGTPLSSSCKLSWVQAQVFPNVQLHSVDFG